MQELCTAPMCFTPPASTCPCCGKDLCPECLAKHTERTKAKPARTIKHAAEHKTTDAKPKAAAMRT